MTYLSFPGLSRYQAALDALSFYQLSWTSMYQAWPCGLPVELVSDVVYRFGLYQFYG
jgi:hypothetical protein